MIIPGNLRHQVTVYRPSTSLDTRGQRTGSATTVLADVPASVETLSGIEQIRARKQYADATHRVTLFGDPSTPFAPTDYLVFGSRVLHVGAIIDRDQLGIEITLLCREEV